MSSTNVHLAWRGPDACRRFRTAISLHSHTLHSHEGMASIVQLAHGIPVLAPLVRRQERRYGEAHGHAFDANRIWWTPPLSPLAAHTLEKNFIVGELGLTPLVSITDHDSIDAPHALRVLDDTRDVPISVEWTVPWRDTFFHLGVHNLPEAQSSPMMAALAAFTANPVETGLFELMEWLTQARDVLIVLNHPYWDEKGIGKEAHRAALAALLRAAKPWIHALEANGLRPWSENREVAQLCRDVDLPLISGGDRHGREPNAVLNLTNASNFAEFAAEVRGDGWSDVYFTRHAADSRALRIYRTVCDIIRDDPEHGLGWVRWNDRVFYRLSSGEVRPVSQAWKDGPPEVISWFVGLVKLLDHDRVAPPFARSAASAEKQSCKGDL